MKTFKEFFCEEEDPYLYHATYHPHISHIMKHGLHGNSGHKNWEDSKKGVVYLAKDPEVARSHAETSDSVPEHYLDKIKVLKVKKTNLAKDKLKDDANVRNDSTDTLEYHGIIHPSHIEKHD